MVDMSLMRPATAEECHALLLYVLKYIDYVCRKENITYYAAYGTLLGAVREHGFVAWDYDADLWMKREDYERFIEAWNKYHSDKYFLQTVDTDKGFFLPFIMRVCMNDTSCWPEIFKDEPFHLGLHVDIFPLDYGFGSAEKDRKKFRNLQFLHLKVFYKVMRKIRYFRTFRSFIWFILHVLPFKILSLRSWIKIYKMVIRNDSPDKSVLIDTGGIYEPEREIYNAELFAETTELPFEDMVIKCPARYDELLTQIYGDYMTPHDRGDSLQLWVKA